MKNPSPRNPGFVSRRGDDRRVAQVLNMEPGRWDVYWEDGASVSVLAPSEDVARLRAQLRRDQSERALGQAVTTFAPNQEVASEVYRRAHAEPTPPAPYLELSASNPVVCQAPLRTRPEPRPLSPVPAPPGRHAARSDTDARARALADAASSDLDDSAPRPVPELPSAPVRPQIIPLPPPVLAPRPPPVRADKPPPASPAVLGIWAAMAVGSTAALIVGTLCLVGALLVLRGAA